MKLFSTVKTFGVHSAQATRRADNTKVSWPTAEFCLFETVGWSVTQVQLSGSVERILHVKFRPKLPETVPVQSTVELSCA